jgi:ATP-dependent DNA helicase Rep
MNTQNDTSSLVDLNPEQRAAVRHMDGPLLVLAGAGSGKTRVITRKIAWMVQACGIEARHIAAITFTNKAAREMKERVSQLLPGNTGRGLTVSTFHSLGLMILRQEAALLGFKPRFSVLDAADAQGILSGILQSTDAQSMRRAAGLISQWKNALLDPEAARVAAQDEAEGQIAHAYREYQATLRAYQAMDFDDLIRLPVALFAEHSEALSRWQNRLRYLLVDEYQDTNGAQYALLKLLAGPAGRFTAVGDDDQAIYAWRGADIENLRRLADDYRGLATIALTRNYRSAQRILEAANRLITHNPRLHEKRLWSELGIGEPIESVCCKDDRHEAESIALRLSAHRFERRTQWKDYAVLYRGNYQARLLEEALRSANIPYQLSGGQSFFDRAEIKDLVAWLRLIANADDDPAFIRAATTPRRGIGATTLEKLGQWSAERHCSMFEACFAEGIDLAPRQRAPLNEFTDFINRIAHRAEREPAGELINELLGAIGYEEWLMQADDERAAKRRWENVCEFRDWLAQKGEEDGKTLIDLTQTVSLMNLLEGREEAEPNAVRLSTLHAAKGLEYDHVYLAGVEEEMLPHRECLEGPRLEEERRLMYVGITRARKSLVLTWCKRRKRGGEWTDCEQSRFITEMDGGALRHAGNAGENADKSTGRQRLAGLKAMLSGQ